MLCFSVYKILAKTDIKMKKQLNINYEYFSKIEELPKIDQELFEVASKIRKQAYAPYSNFLVGCAILLKNGKIITGNNQENAAYPSGLCAERTAIFWTSANYPKEKVLKIFIVGGADNETNGIPIPPCGACRQSILEYEIKQDQDIEFYFASVKGETYKTHSIKELLPFCFDISFL